MRGETEEAAEEDVAGFLHAERVRDHEGEAAQAVEQAVDGERGDD